MIILLDNYDSFTYNLYHYLLQLGESVKVIRNDEVNPDDILNQKPLGIVISPGPCDPDKAGITLDLIKRNDGKTPVLGVCLGHQAIAQVYGGKIIRANEPVHGKTAQIEHINSNVFKGLPSPFTSTRYHSLIVEEESFPDSLEITATTTEKDGSNVIMGLAHKEKPVYGVQFHPESIASEKGHDILQNFINISKAHQGLKP
jgi:anthranilate synthase component 2